MTPEAYARQFALARRIESVAARVAAAVTAAEAAHKRLAAGGTADLDLRIQALLGPDFGSAPPLRPRPGSRRCAHSRESWPLAGRGGRRGRAPLPGRGDGFAQIEPVVEGSLTAWQALQAQVPAAP
jgi:hypothetical protein